jgi:hypothetical protein
MIINNDFDAQNQLQAELLADEKLLWASKPAGGLKFRTSDALFIPFSILWFGFAIFWEFGATMSGGGPFFTIWGIPFVCIGFYICIGRFFYDKKNRENTVYGITNNRIIIKSGVFNTTVDSFNIRSLVNLNIETKPDGSGTIKLDADKTPFASFTPVGWPGSKRAPALEFIQNVRDVYNLILQQQHQN